MSDNDSNDDSITTSTADKGKARASSIDTQAHQRPKSAAQEQRQPKPVKEPEIEVEKDEEMGDIEKPSLPQLLPTPEPREDDQAKDVFGLKLIQWKDRSVRVICQNENGPCPLLAICNALILMDELVLPEQQELISAERLTALVGDRLLSRTAASESTSPTDLTSLMDVIPRLKTGLDVNVNHIKPSQFDNTPELSFFSALGLHLYHAWVLDPQDDELYMTILTCTNGTPLYNSVVDCVVRGHEAESKLLTMDTNLNDRHVGGGASLSSSEASAVSSSKAGASSSKGGLMESTEVLQQAVQSGLKCQEFLNSTSSQVTYRGLQMLGEELAVETPAVFFRNNHFLTIYKQPLPDGKNYLLMTLVTDIGYMAKPVVWETLSNVEGDSQFLDGQFQLFQEPTTPSLPPRSTSTPQPPLQSALLYETEEKREEKRDQRPSTEEPSSLQKFSDRVVQTFRSIVDDVMDTNTEPAQKPSSTTRSSVPEDVMAHVPATADQTNTKAVDPIMNKLQTPTTPLTKSEMEDRDLALAIYLAEQENAAVNGSNEGDGVGTRPQTRETRSPLKENCLLM